MCLFPHGHIRMIGSADAREVVAKPLFGGRNLLPDIKFLKSTGTGDISIDHVQIGGAVFSFLADINTRDARQSLRTGTSGGTDGNPASNAIVLQHRSQSGVMKPEASGQKEPSPVRSHPVTCGAAWDVFKGVSGISCL